MPDFSALKISTQRKAEIAKTSILLLEVLIQDAKEVSRIPQNKIDLQVAADFIEKTGKLLKSHYSAQLVREMPGKSK